MKKIFALLATLSFLLSASIVFADESVPVMKKTGTENAMMKGKGKKLGLKKKVVKKKAKKMMKKVMKKKRMKKMEKVNEGTTGTAEDGTGTSNGIGAGGTTGTGFSSGSGTTGGIGTDTVTAPSANAQTIGVNIQNFSFATLTVTVKVGDTVKWTNLDSVGHTVESNDGTTFKSSTLVINDTFSKTFTAAGTFAYHCGLHPSMTGTVIVTE